MPAIRLLFFATIFLFFLIQPVIGQILLKGVITEAGSNQPVSKASVTIPGTSLGTKTDSVGAFNLLIYQFPKLIYISCVGYKSQQVPIEDSILSILLEPVGPQILNEFNVTSKYYKQYSLNTVSSALRLQTPLINLSQHIQEISQEVIRDQAAFNMTEGISRNVSGVVRQEVSNNLGPYMFMRGGQISSLRNGIDLTPIYRGPVPEDVAIIDRVEFIKGPSLFMSNIGDPAGTFNVVTKQPTGIKRQSVDVMLGNWDFYRVAADLSGVLDKKKRLQYCMNIMGMATNSFVKYDFNRRFLIAPVLKYVLNDRTSITAEYNFQQFRYGLMSPIVMSPDGFGTLPNDFTITEKSLPPYHVTDHTAFLTFSHRFNDQWQVTVRGAMMRNDKEGIYMWVTGVNTADPHILLRNPKYDLDRAVVFSEQAFINGKFHTGSVKHQLLAGIDVNQKKFLADSYISYDTYLDGYGNAQPTYYPLDIQAPQYGTLIPRYHTPGGIRNGNTRQEIAYYSLYVLDELSAFKDKLRLTFGGRFTGICTDNIISGLTTSSADKVFTPRLGISYSILPAFTVYALHDKTIVPQAGITSSGTVIQPLKGRNYEIGFKKNWMAGRWNSTLAFYKIHRTGIMSADPDNSQYRIQVGETRAQGFDIDITGQLFRHLNVVINYAYNDATIERDINKLLIGTPTPMYVKHVQNTWLNYELPLEEENTFSFSLGYQFQGGRGERYATANQQITPDFFRLDAGIGWKCNKININVLVNNLLNKHLIATPWFRGGLYYWVPQASINGRLALSYNF
ncbi:TonB-dependent siderophore receptor [Chitinophaga rhizophila]|uniref:TonB-dependent receptor n=1 Tax=Chitinophaga rhizophila TaxID=2866212 RepID=A0ABS7GI65_9BACT|nr:TonB-dependent siderophore receptor [Chitinophaga rhizophila]MBW8687384.1 TonB-dependent receptor [Chitinophaga rhizophila]